MRRFKHIVGYVPHNECDEQIVQWCASLAKAAESESIELVICHEEFYADLQDSKMSWADFAETEVQRLSDMVKGHEQAELFKVTVLNDAPVKGMLEILASGENDLLVLPQETAYGISLVDRLCRKSPIGVCVVPKGCVPQFDSILLGVDFSDLSTLALEWAEVFARICDSRAVQLHAVHVVALPTHSRALQATDPNMLKGRLDCVATKQLEAFVSEHAAHPELWHKKVVDYHLPGYQLVTESEELMADLIVIGSHGRNALSVALLGGQTSDLIRETKTPLLIAKRKNESLGFLKQLLGLS